MVPAVAEPAGTSRVLRPVTWVRCSTSLCPGNWFRQKLPFRLTAVHETSCSCRCWHRGRLGEVMLGQAVRKATGRVYHLHGRCRI